MKRAAILTLSGLGAAAIGFSCWLLLSPRPSVAGSTTGPNGYVECLEIAMALAPMPTKQEELKPEELRAFVRGNAEALQRARLALEKPWSTPLPDSAAAESNHIAILGGFKRLALAFAAEGKLAEQEKRNADACRAYLDAIHLGHLVSRDGVVIDVLVGLAGQGIGARALTGLQGRLSAEECRVAIGRLERMDASAVSPATMMAGERAWRIRVHGWRGQLAALVTLKSLQKMEQNAVSKLQAQQRANRRLLIDLAARAHEVEKGQPPQTGADLVPSYLAGLPVDPATGAVMSVAP